MNPDTNNIHALTLVCCLCIQHRGDPAGAGCHQRGAPRRVPRAAGRHRAAADPRRRVLLPGRGEQGAVQDVA